MTGSVTRDRNRGAVIGLEDSLTRLPGPNGEPWAELFTHGTLSVEIFAPQGVDTQSPHTRDEVYFVARGRGEFVVDGRPRPIKSGDFLFVRAHVPHRFENFSEDLALWVVFYGPEGGEAAADSG